jgi:hypothetical protein
VTARALLTPRALSGVACIITLLAAGCAPGGGPGTSRETTTASANQVLPSPPAPTVRCGGPDTQEVSTAEALRAALARARPGAVIRLRDGRYPGRFTITSAARAQQPITLCGSRAAVLDGGSTDTGYTLYLLGADHWQLSGFTIRGGQKGLVLDNTREALIEGLLVRDVGDEAIHLRTASSGNVVQHNTIRGTGSHERKFGEGIYIGSAESNWCTYTNCAPDRSDRNIIQGNDIADTSAENIDVKEGTTGGIIRGNILSGAATTAAESWVNIKGNDWLIADNTGTDAPEDGFQTHTILDGWGQRNTFQNNTANVNAPGYAIHITKKGLGNVVSCTNRARNAGSGLSNVPCQ